MNTSQESPSVRESAQQGDIQRFEVPVDVKTAARFLGVSPSLVYAYVERKQIPHSRMMGRAIRFSLSELEKWRRQFIVNGGINEYYRRTSQDLRDRFCPQEIRIWVGRVPGP